VYRCIAEKQEGQLGRTQPTLLNASRLLLISNASMSAVTQWCRRNYADIVMGASGLFLLRNPLGTVSLVLLAAGAALYVDTIASGASSKIVSLIQQGNPQLAAQIRSKPGGHDGRRYEVKVDYLCHVFVCLCFWWSAWCHRFPSGFGKLDLAIQHAAYHLASSQS
jgi:hypothetical protein